VGLTDDVTEQPLWHSSDEGVGLTEEGTGSVTLALLKGGVGLTDEEPDQPLWHSSEEEWD
jgi:hypothetical protein